MNGPKHTPGPWHENVDGVVVADKPGPWREIVADVYSSPIDAGNRKANTRLIAAAPDLLEALEALVAQSLDSGHPHDWLRHEIDQARAALAKARGES